MFGRDYLFPEDWSKDVAPAVEALQLSSGLEFADPVAVNALPEADYAVKVAGFMFGPTLRAELTTSMPRWRALGLVEGEPSVASVNAAVSTWQPAFYDPADGQIYRSATATGPAFDAAMRSALGCRAGRSTGARRARSGRRLRPPTASLAQLAVDDFGAELVAGPSTDALPNRAALGPLPVPLAHRLLGVEDLGGPILESLGVVSRPRRGGRRFRRRRHERARRAVDGGTGSGDARRRHPGRRCGGRPRQRLLVHGVGGVPAGRDGGGRRQLDQR